MDLRNTILVTLYTIYFFIAVGIYISVAYLKWMPSIFQHEKEERMANFSKVNETFLEGRHNVSGRSHRNRRDLNEDSKDDVATSEEFIRKNLKITNKYRALHDAAPLELDWKLCVDAEKWAKKLASKSDAKDEPVLTPSWTYATGESIFATRDNETVSGRAVAERWYGGCKSHVWDPNYFSKKSSRFSQLVWKDSEKMGIGQAKTKTQGGITIVVARYLPAGNWAYKSAFAANVAPKKEGSGKCWKPSGDETISNLDIELPVRKKSSKNKGSSGGGSKDPDASAEKSKTKKDPDASAEKSKSKKDPDASAEKSKSKKDPDASAEKSKTKKDPDASAEKSKTKKDPDASAEKSKSTKDPDASAEKSKRKNDPDASAEKSKSKKDPDASAEKSKTKKDPDASAEKSKSKKDPDASAEKSKTKKDPDASAEKSKTKKDPDASAEKSKTKKDPDASAEKSKTKKDPDASAEKSKSKKDPDASGEKGKKDPDDSTESGGGTSRKHKGKGKDGKEDATSGETTTKKCDKTEAPAGRSLTEAKKDKEDDKPKGRSVVNRSKTKRPTNKNESKEKSKNKGKKETSEKSKNKSKKARGRSSKENSGKKKT